MNLAPTPRAILLIAAAAPVALLLGVIVPRFWAVGFLWVGFILILSLVDGVLAAARGVTLTARKPQTVSIGESFAVHIEVAFPVRVQVRKPEVALAVSANLDPGHVLTKPLLGDPQSCATEIWLTPHRRGEAVVNRLWLRWTGRLGLMAQQREFPCAHITLVTPDVRPVHTEGIQLLQRNALHGLMAQRQRGEGSDFEALADFRSGMDRRAIDWKASARHANLLAKEYRPERDNRIVFAIDCGRAMSEPLAGIPRVDRAVTAALLASYAALKLGDRVSLYAFDARPRLQSATLVGVESFPLLQQQAATIDYSSEETNHVFALSRLAQQLSRRALIILFTDFTDPTGADLLVRSVGWLLKRHVVLFVILRDEDLVEALQAAPTTSRIVARAVTAAALLNEQRRVKLRLQRLGLDVLEATHQSIGLDLINAYFALKQRGRL